MSDLDHILAELLPGQAYTCDAGCGECDPVEYDFVHYTRTTQEGVVVETRAYKAWKSDCCGATMAVWDMVKETMVDAAAPLNLPKVEE